MQPSLAAEHIPTSLSAQAPNSRQTPLALFADRQWKVHALKDLSAIDLPRADDAPCATMHSHRSSNGAVVATSPRAASPAACKRLLRALLELADPLTGECFATRETLSRAMGLSGSSGSRLYVRRIVRTLDHLELIEYLPQEYTAWRHRMRRHEAPCTYVVRVDRLRELEAASEPRRRWRGRPELRVIAGELVDAPSAPAAVAVPLDVQQAYERARRHRYHGHGLERRDRELVPETLSAIQAVIADVSRATGSPARDVREAVMRAYMAQPGFRDGRLEAERHALQMFAPHAEAVRVRAIRLLSGEDATQASGDPVASPVDVASYAAQIATITAGARRPI